MQIRLGYVLVFVFGKYNCSPNKHCIRYKVSAVDADYVLLTCYRFLFEILSMQLSLSINYQIRWSYH